MARFNLLFLVSLTLHAVTVLISHFTIAQRFPTHGFTFVGDRILASASLLDECGRIVVASVLCYAWSAALQSAFLVWCLSRAKAFWIAYTGAIGLAAMYDIGLNVWLGQTLALPELARLFAAPAVVAIAGASFSVVLARRQRRRRSDNAAQA